MFQPSPQERSRAVSYRGCTFIISTGSAGEGLYWACSVGPKTGKCKEVCGGFSGVCGRWGTFIGMNGAPSLNIHGSLIHPQFQPFKRHLANYFNYLSIFHWKIHFCFFSTFLEIFCNLSQLATVELPPLGITEKALHFSPACLYACVWVLHLCNKNPGEVLIKYNK